MLIAHLIKAVLCFQFISFSTCGDDNSDLVELVFQSYYLRFLVLDPHLEQFLVFLRLSQLAFDHLELLR